uniref:Uncharacterized protein n=1 Tax=Wuchereria bancrofti TaxID=6293 RepID=A0AAF5Q1P6_WUCBA
MISIDGSKLTKKNKSGQKRKNAINTSSCKKDGKTKMKKMVKSAGTEAVLEHEEERIKAIRQKKWKPYITKPKSSKVITAYEQHKHICKAKTKDDLNINEYVEQKQAERLLVEEKSQSEISNV